MSCDQQEQVLRQELMEKGEALQEGASRESNHNKRIASLEGQLSSLTSQLERATQQYTVSKQEVSALNAAQSDLSKKILAQQESHGKVVKEVSVPPRAQFAEPDCEMFHGLLCICETFYR